MGSKPEQPTRDQVKVLHYPGVSHYRRQILENPASTMTVEDHFTQAWKRKQSNPATRDWHHWLHGTMPEPPVHIDPSRHQWLRLVSFLMFDPEDPHE